VVKGVLWAEKISKLASSPRKERNLRLSSVRSIQYQGVKDRLVAVRGEIARKGRDLTVAQSGDSIKLNTDALPELDSLWKVATWWCWQRCSLVSWGMRSTRSRSSGDSLSARGRAGDGPARPRDSCQKPVGKLVRVEGQLAEYIGAEEATLLSDGKNVLVVHPAEKYLSIEPETAATVHVIGVFDFETHKGKEMGVLKDARIDLPDIKVTKPLKP